MSDAFQAISRLLAPLSRKIAALVSRGAVTMVNDATNCQNLQVTLTADEVQDELEHMQTYGLTAVPLKDAEAVLICVGGSRSHGIVISTPDRRWRPKNLKEGDVCLYIAKASGERVYLDNANDIVNLGAKAAADFLAKATNTENRLAALEGWAIGHMHPSAAPGPPTPPTPLAPFVPFNTPPQPVATTRVKGT